MALRHKKLLHRIATWVATSPELNGATDDLIMWAVWRKYQGQIEKRDLPFIVDQLIRTLREMVRLEAIEAANLTPPPAPRRRAKRPAAALPLFDYPRGIASLSEAEPTAAPPSQNHKPGKLGRLVREKGDDMTDTTTMDDKRTAEFQRLLSRVAHEAITKRGMSPIDVAGAFMGTGHGVLETTFGTKKCDEYLFTMVEELLGGKLKP